ncbi:RteC protein [compost metagenome]
MTKYTTKQYGLMMDKLTEIARESSNNLQKAERSLALVQTYIQELKLFVLDYEFCDEAEEISFFKQIKPMFLKELIYHKEVYHIEANRPYGNSETLIAYYRQIVTTIGLYFSRNQSLYNYYQAEKTNSDREYYLRDFQHNTVDNTMDIDSRLCTIHSNKLSKLLAFEMVGHHVHKSIYHLENPSMSEEGNQRKFTNQWTGSLVDLIELGYALYAGGAVNNGRGDIKQIMTDLELIFNIDLGNYYRTFQNMRLRKKNLTPFLDNLKDNLVRKMEDY